LSLGAKGFRPFFLLGAVFGAAIVPLWLLVFTGQLTVRGPLQGIVWHGHEMIHGFTVAIIAGFLLTAVGNWTQRETVVGPALHVLALVWLAGRLAMLFLPGWPASVVDLAFLPALAVGIARPLVAAKNTRNAAFPMLLLALWATNLATHLDAAGLWLGAGVLANRVAVYLVAVIILVVTGRVVPMFTRNATGVPEIGNVRALDWTATIATGALAALQLWPAGPVHAVVAGIAGAATLGRTWRWGTRHTFGQPLLWVLHAGHALVGVGLLLTALQALIGGPPSAPLHAVTAGGIGALTLGMMARVALGHTGRPLRVGTPMAVAFGAIVLAALVRVFAPWLLPGSLIPALWVAAALWSAGFVAYAAIYAPWLVAPRPDGKPG
jgi:uncharacterized protein involved in response to NO